MVLNVYTNVVISSLLLFLLPLYVGVLRLHLVLRNTSCIPLSLVIISLRCLWMLFHLRQSFCYTIDAVFVGAPIIW